MSNWFLKNFYYCNEIDVLVNMYFIRIFCKILFEVDGNEKELLSKCFL